MEVFSYMIDKMMESGEYHKWNKSSPDRFKYEMLVRYNTSGVINSISGVLEIMTVAAHINNDIELRMDMLCLLEVLLQNAHPALPPLINQHSLLIVQRILLPSARWKMGKAQIKTRKASLINIIYMIFLYK